MRHRCRVQTLTRRCLRPTRGRSPGAKVDSCDHLVPRSRKLVKPEENKARGAYYTPPAVAAALVGWAVRRSDDRLLDPSCGDGRFLAHHRNSIGIDNNPQAVASASAAVPDARVVCADFYEWAAASADRFDCAVGNPPFIRYQRFSGQQRRCALALCASLGVRLSGLCSSWVPHLIAAASLLRPGGRMAFVVPAEIGHAPYAAPLVEWFAGHFADLRVVAVREKLFPELSEDVWLLFADDLISTPRTPCRMPCGAISIPRRARRRNGVTSAVSAILGMPCPTCLRPTCSCPT